MLLAKVSTLRYGGRVNFPTIKLPTFDLPTIDLPTIDLPRFELPEVSLPSVDLPSAEQIGAFARDAAHVGVGLAVMTVERLRALQTQLVELVTTSATNVVGRVRDAV